MAGPVFTTGPTMETPATTAIPMAVRRTGTMVRGMPMGRGVVLRAGTTGQEAPEVGGEARRRGTMDPVTSADIAEVPLRGVVAQAAQPDGGEARRPGVGDRGPFTGQTGVQAPGGAEVA